MGRRKIISSREEDDEIENIKRKMKRQYKKPPVFGDKPACYGTKEYCETHGVCKRCQFRAKCKARQSLWRLNL